jgi:hypothetical protein
VAYDTELVERIRELLAPERGVDEKRMFGGLAFLINGHMAVAASREGGLLVRCRRRKPTSCSIVRTSARW